MACDAAKTDLERARLFWVAVNEITWKLTDGSLSRTPNCHGNWGGYNSERALGWVIDAGWVTGRSIWFARVGNRVSGPAKLADAKRAAERLVAGDTEGSGQGRLNLNSIGAALLDRAVVSSGDGVRSVVTQLAKPTLVTRGAR